MTSMLSAAALLLSIVGWTTACCKALRLPFALSAASACSGIICLLFVAALAGLLRPAQLTLLGGGIAALLLCARLTPAAEIRSAMLSAGFTAFVAAFLALAVLTRNSALSIWDEFATWGAVAKVLLLTDALPLAPGSVNFRDYPVGSALLEYFVARPFAYSEGRMIFGHALLDAVCVLPAVGCLGWRNPLLVLGTFALCLLAPTIFSVTWMTVLVDNTVALMFASLIMVYVLGGCGTRAMVACVPVAGATSVVKQVGLLFAMVFAALVAIDKMVSIVHEHRVRETITLKFLAAYLSATCVPILLTQLWNAHGAAIGVRPVFRVDGDRMQKLLGAGEQIAIVSTKFMAALQGSEAVGWIGLGVPGWLALMAALAVMSVAAQASWERRARLAAVQLVLTAGFCGYTLFLYVFYIFGLTFSPSESLQLGSFGRYVGTYFLSWGLASVAVFTAALTRGAKRRSLSVVFAVLIGALGFTTRDSWISWFQDASAADLETVRMRNGMKSRLGNFSSFIPADGRVYSLWNGTTGLLHFVSSFELKPRRTNFSCFSLGERRFAGDIWSCDWSAALFRNELRSYDFVLLGQSDDNFWSRYGALFAAGARDSGAVFFRIDNSTPAGLLYAVTPQAHSVSPTVNASIPNWPLALANGIGCQGRPAHAGISNPSSTVRFAK